jgi:hypothetical protein
MVCTQTAQYESVSGRVHVAFCAETGAGLRPLNQTGAVLRVCADSRHVHAQTVGRCRRRGALCSSMIRLVIVLVCFGACDSTPPPQLPSTDPPTAPTPIDSIDRLATSAFGYYDTDAYVTSIHPCMPCRGPDPCAPCAPTSLEVASKPSGAVAVPLSAGEVRAFQIGARYRFTIGVDGGPDGAGRRSTVYRAVPAPR